MICAWKITKASRFNRNRGFGPTTTTENDMKTLLAATLATLAITGANAEFMNGPGQLDGVVIGTNAEARGVSVWIGFGEPGDGCHPRMSLMREAKGAPGDIGHYTARVDAEAPVDITATAMQIGTLHSLSVGATDDMVAQLKRGNTLRIKLQLEAGHSYHEVNLRGFARAYSHAHAVCMKKSATKSHFE